MNTIVSAAYWTTVAAVAFLLWASLGRAEGADAPGAASAQTQPAAGKIKVLMLGDSITHYGLAPATEKALKAYSAGGLQWTTVDAGVGGETAETGKGRIAALLEREKPQIVTVQYGANDIAHLYTPEQFGQHMKGIVEIIQASAAAPRIVLMTTTPVDANRHSFGTDKRLIAKGGADYVLDSEYNAATRELAAAKGLALVDLHRYFQTAKDPMALLVKDGIHLTPEGYEFISAHLARAMAEAYGADVLKAPDAIAARAAAAKEMESIRKGLAAGDDASKYRGRLDKAWQGCPYLAEAAVVWGRVTYPAAASRAAVTRPASP